MNNINCFSFIIRNNRVFQRKGIGCDGLVDNNKLMLNGLGVYRLWRTPVDMAETDQSDEQIAECFKEYSSGEPWVGKSNGEYLLYSANISPDNFHLKSYCAEKSTEEYVLIRAPKEYNIRVLGDGRLIFRRYEADEIIALLAVDGCAMIDVETEYILLMIEHIDYGKFVCR